MKPKAEVWRCDVGGASVAVLDIPGSLERHRSFDVDVTLVVRVPQPLARNEYVTRTSIDGVVTRSVRDTAWAFAAAHPWVEGENVRPKSIAREMFERYLSFADYIRAESVKWAQVARSAGIQPE